mgnify:CR=1 FL=1
MSTIAAISTATGSGGIGIIRLSGEKSIEIIKKIFKPIDKKINLDEVKGYTIKYGFIVDSYNEKIDEVLVSFFRAPKSYTTEDMCEINSHGGTVIERKILEQCLLNGAELAEPGEFTKRAFLNGRIDLSQAESVIDIINAKTDKEAKESFKQLQGNLSIELNNIKDNLLDIMSDIEASIDYPEYDIEETTNSKALKVLNEIRNKLVDLEKSFENGKILKEGVKTVIVGKPNAGKSSLLNTLLKEDRAIVSDYAGTTRDTIEEFINVDGIPLKIIDTAGIRETNDFVEKIGVEKAIGLIKDADLVIALFDSSKELEEEDYKILELIKNKKSIVLLNKSDLSDLNIKTINYISNTNKKVIKASMKTKNGIDKLYKTISELFNNNELNSDNGIVITNIRHKNLIHNAINNLDEAENSIKNDMPIDVVAICIKEVLESIGSITGDNVSEDIINKIFSKFCLGK